MELYIDKILKRRDGSSLVVAILLAGIFAQLTTLLPARLAQVLSGSRVAMATQGQGWQFQYLYPIVTVTLELITLELLLRLFVKLREIKKSKARASATPRPQRTAQEL